LPVVVRIHHLVILTVCVLIAAGIHTATARADPSCVTPDGWPCPPLPSLQRSGPDADRTFLAQVSEVALIRNRAAVIYAGHAWCMSLHDQGETRAGIAATAVEMYPTLTPGDARTLVDAAITATARNIYSRGRANRQSASKNLPPAGWHIAGLAKATQRPRSRPGIPQNTL
jgi:Protein of unknown function (DUF732)